ncbi:GNAT family N-acetyltransferase [Microbacterium sp. H83]|uniref:GNAT family N-acetyltransferase n=1 Tax=Microbacterium sp. H83 TaxID=1827324 RepID=UPI0007F4326A|nr:GNAT family N-acetyltransferase [Microbacterium sp. H83]OAN34004.1 hypothetical protein A4X16_06015 [Microbacterium sp. H83]
MIPDTVTDRLVLSPIDAADATTVEAIFALQSDPATWRHLPEAVETDISQSRSMAEDYSRSWRHHGVGWWVVRLRDPLPGVGPEEIVGLGGAAMRRPDIRAWNVGYRLSPRIWGHAFATEIAVAAARAANAADPETPVTARALSRNVASWRTLERAGLVLRWEGEDAAEYRPTSGVLRRVYADRDLGDALLNQLIAQG